jgi:UDP-N-acetylglucosamine diphosphorylase/glucosamine-1-phosphate N-acetyltransferase
MAGKKSTDHSIRAVILAAGKGVRMRSEIPKVLHSLHGKPLVVHVIENVRGAGIDDIIVVVGYMGTRVMETVGGDVQYVWQHEQRGTGHAVMQAEAVLGGFNGLLLVACGDVPLIKPRTIRRMLEAAVVPGVKAVVLSMVPENPSGYGRIINDGNGALLRIVEERDATDDQRMIAEVNTGTYVFHSDVLFNGLKTVTTGNVQGEYYLPDVFAFIRESGWSTGVVRLADAVEGSGINSVEELLRLESNSGAANLQ